MGTIRLSDDFVSPAISKPDPKITLNQKVNQTISGQLERVYDPEVYTEDFKLQPAILKTKLHLYIKADPGYAHGQLSWTPNTFVNGSYINQDLTVNVTDATPIEDVVIPEGYEDYYLHNSIRNFYDDTNYDSYSSVENLTGNVIVFDLDNQLSKETSLNNIWFRDNKNITGLDLNNLDVSKIKDFGYVFSGLSNLSELKIDQWNTSGATSFYRTFRISHSMALNVNNLDVSNVTNLSDCFQSAYGLTSLDLSNWNTLSCTNMQTMFNSAWNLVALDLSNFNTVNVTSMASMFGNFGSTFKYLIIGSEEFKFQLKESQTLPSTCKILVPSALISTYQNATNWSAHASKFDAIENYTITRSNGQVTVTPNNA